MLINFEQSHEVEPCIWSHSWYRTRGRVETLDANLSSHMKWSHAYGLILGTEVQFKEN